MEQGLKERLVGAAVLVVLAVIFVPMVFDGPEQPPADAPTSIAPVPVGGSTFRYDLAAPLPEQGGAAAPTTAAAPAVAAATTAATPSATAAPTPTKPATTTAPAPATKATVVTTTAPKPPAPKPTAAAPTPANGWAAQVGSFSKQATADAVATDLKSKGFKAFVVPHQDGKTTLYRVRVGPVATRDAADVLAKKIIAKTGQTARPVPHP